MESMAGFVGIRKYGELIESLGISIAEDAWRGSDMGIELHLKETRLVLKQAIATYKDLDALADGRAS